MSRPRLAHHSTEALITEMRMRSALLHRRRAELIRQIAELDRQIAESGSAPGARQGRRRRNEQSLAGALAEVLKGKEMDITEAAEAVLAAGHVRNARSVYAAVAQRLTDTERFRRVRRGVYTAR